MSDGSGPPLEVHDLDDARRAEWDAFVQDCPDATFFHLSGWKPVIERTFGHRCYFLAAVSRGRIRGVLPLVHVASRLFGSSLVSNAFCVYGGPAALDDASRSALDGAAIELAQRLNVDHLEYRLRAPAHRDWAQNADLYVTFRKTLDPDPEKNLADIPRKQRAMVRKAIKFGLRSEVDADVERFYRLFSESVRNLGTPVFSKQYFRNLNQVFGPACEILTVSHEGRPISGVMSFLFRDEILPYYGGGTSEARHFAANDFMYWEVMRRSAERGLRVFDYGRSKVGTGSYRFKKNWGFEPEALPYQYRLVLAPEVPNVSPSNPKYRFFVSAWRKLPVSLSKIVGPFLSGSLA